MNKEKHIVAAVENQRRLELRDFSDGDHEVTVTAVSPSVTRPCSQHPLLVPSPKTSQRLHTGTAVRKSGSSSQCCPELWCIVVALHVTHEKTLCNGSALQYRPEVTKRLRHTRFPSSPLCSCLFWSYAYKYGYRRHIAYHCPLKF